MKDQLQTIREAWEEVLANFDHAISGGIWRVTEGSQTWEAVQAAKQSLAALAQLEAMVGKPVAYLYASIAGPVELHRLQQIGHAKPLYFQDQLENDLRAQTEYPDAHSCVPLYSAPVAQQPQAEAVAWRARDANGRWMYGDLPAPDLPAGEAELLALVAPQQAEAVPPGYVLVHSAVLRKLGIDDEVIAAITQQKGGV